MLIYHVALAADWDAAQSTGSYRTSTLGRTLDDEGFIHCSYADQVAGVANTFYAGVSDAVVLLTVDTDAVGSEVIAENTGGGIELFPHVYGPIPVAAVVAVTELPRDADGRIAVPDLPPALASAPGGGFSPAPDAAAG